MQLLFRKTIKLGENETKIKSNGETWKQRCRKWDRSIASMFGLLAFFTLVGIVIFNIFSKKSTDCEDSSDDNPKTSRKSKAKCYILECAITCQSIPETESVADYINQLNVPCDNIEELMIEKSKFKNGELTSGWLANITPKIAKLTIADSNLKEINGGALVDHPFKSLGSLVIVNSEIETLKKHSFLSLGLSELALRNNDLKLLTIEEYALEGVRDNLRSLQIEGFKLFPESIINLTGERAASLDKLDIVAIRSNILRELPANSFYNALNVVSLYLHNNNLEIIDPNTFSKTRKIQLLHLNDNSLKTLSNGTFRNLNLPDGKLFIQNNVWHCDCSLQWLKDDYMSKINQDLFPLCHNSPCKLRSCEEGKFENFEFCSTTATSSPSSLGTSDTTASVGITTLTSSSTSPLTTTPSGCSEIAVDAGTVTIMCTTPIPEFQNAVVENRHRAEIIVENEQVVLEFQELAGEPLQVKTVIIKTAEDLNNYRLVWFNSDNKSENGCITIIQNSTILKNLNRGATYTFSVLHECESETSPKCTFAFKTLPEWSLRTWISNQYQSVVIGLAVLLVVCLICLSMFVTFLCIRRHPKLISSNKSVIIVKPRKTSEEAIPPREYEKPTYWEPYLVPSSQGYLTPKFHRYSKIKYRPPLMRSISEWSVSSNPSIYADPAKQLRDWRNLQPRRQNLENQVMEVHDYNDYRPPLPPPNPGTSSDTASQNTEVLYSSV